MSKQYVIKTDGKWLTAWGIKKDDTWIWATYDEDRSKALAFDKLKVARLVAVDEGGKVLKVKHTLRTVSEEDLKDAAERLSNIVLTVGGGLIENGVYDILLDLVNKERDRRTK